MEISPWQHSSRIPWIDAIDKEARKVRVARGERAILTWNFFHHVILHAQCFGSEVRDARDRGRAAVSLCFALLLYFCVFYA